MGIWRCVPFPVCIISLNFPLLFPTICRACATQGIKPVPGLAHKTLSFFPILIQTHKKALRMKIRTETADRATTARVRMKMRNLTTNNYGEDKDGRGIG